MSCHTARLYCSLFYCWFDSTATAYIWWVFQEICTTDSFLLFDYIFLIRGKDSKNSVFMGCLTEQIWGKLLHRTFISIFISNFLVKRPHNRYLITFFLVVDKNCTISCYIKCSVQASKLNCLFFLFQKFLSCFNKNFSHKFKFETTIVF